MRRIIASLATPPFTYDVPDDQPANLMFLGSVFHTHGWLVPVFRVRRATGELVNIVANSVAGFGDSVGIWFPDQLTLPIAFDPALLSQRLVRAGRARLDDLHAQVPDATRINLECHGAYSIQSEDAVPLAGMLARQLPDPGQLSLDDIAAGNARYQAALAHFDDLDRFERLLHLLLSMLHHMLANDMPGLVAADEDPCETAPLWVRDGERPEAEWAWIGSSLYRTYLAEESQPVEDVEQDPDRIVALRKATGALARAPWSPLLHLRYAQANLKFPNQQGTVIHATEALLLIGDGEPLPEVAGPAHATRGLAWARHRKLSPRADELAVADLERAIELGAVDDEVTEALRALQTNN